MPDFPSEFKGYLCGRSSRYVLEKLHVHARDAQLTFTESTHQYCIDGVVTLGSVTGLVHRFVSSFEPELVIRRMRGSSNWPRAKYLKSDVVAALESVVCPECEADLQDLICRIKSQGMLPEIICSELQSVARCFPSIKEEIYCAVSLGDDEIVGLWNSWRDDAAGRGTYMNQ